MSQSPTAIHKESAAEYFRNWDALGLLIARGSSFSGHERHCVFLNTGGTRFADVSSATELDLLDDGRAVALTDWDHDGDLDLWFANRTAPRLRLLRNELPGARSSLAVRLEGRTCNRDAVGARVEVHLQGDSRRRVETLRAGDGFLTQSSKWLHFGLGADEVARLRVRWPGTREWDEFTNIKKGGRYLVVQGEATASKLPDRATVALTPSEPGAGPSSSALRVVLSHPVELPPLEYEDFDQLPVNLVGTHDGPLLLNLWASWCRPCLTELRDLAKSKAVLEEFGLKVVALTVDGLDGSAANDVITARQFLDDLEFPFDSGLATTEVLRRLTAVHGRVFYKERPLPLPCSFLLDGRGRWAVLYRGPLSVEQLRADLEMIQGPSDGLLGEALPREGRFFYQGPGINPLAMVDAYREGGYLAEAKQGLDEILARIEVAESSSTEDSGTSSRGAKLDVYRRLAAIETERGRTGAAVAAWAETVRLAPESTELQMNLAVALVRDGQVRSAEAWLDQAVGSAPDDPTTHRLVGRTCLQIGKPDAAVKHFQQAVKLSDTTDARFELGTAFQLSRDFEAAIREYQTVLRQQDDRWSRRAANNLAWLYATNPDPDIRDGTQAIELAEYACRVSENKNPTYLGTLGSAYAEAGQFQEAVRISRRALKLALATGAGSLADSLRERIDLYLNRRPYREGPEPPR